MSTSKLSKEFLAKGRDLKKEKLLKLAQDFVKENRIGGPEVVWHSEGVEIGVVCEFLEQVCDIVGYDKNGMRF